MGAWGSGTFENDSALDWVGQLTESDDASPIEEAFDAVIETDEDLIDTDDCSNALAAAEIVAAMSGRGSGALPDELNAWIKGKPRPGPDLVKKARDAVAEVLTDQSELLELWKDAEPDDFKAWKAGVDDLKKRLG
jgi:hypothetical protein